MSTLRDRLSSAARESRIPGSALRAIADYFGFSLHDTEEVALELGIMPERYLRNADTISIDAQLKLMQSTVAVIGCGGLGGYLVEELARLGVGTLVLFDPDVFEEHNLNRQILSDTTTIGTPKIDAAFHRIAAVNPAVQVRAYGTAFSKSFGRDEIKGSRAAADALDSIPARLELAAICGELGIPLVHGSIAGWYGQVAVQYPGEKIIETIFAGVHAARGVEARTGNPAFTPAVTASLQAAEICGILLGRESALRGKMLCIDLERMDFQSVEIG
jgi:molybdopterin/thiamine biosynthesis adenylyltransferase